MINTDHCPGCEGRGEEAEQLRDPARETPRGHQVRGQQEAVGQRHPQEQEQPRDPRRDGEAHRRRQGHHPLPQPGRQGGRTIFC